MTEKKKPSQIDRTTDDGGPERQTDHIKKCVRIFQVNCLRFVLLGHRTPGLSLVGHRTPGFVLLGHRSLERTCSPVTLVFQVVEAGFLEHTAAEGGQLVGHGGGVPSRFSVQTNTLSIDYTTVMDYSIRRPRAPSLSAMEAVCPAASLYKQTHSV